MSWGTMAPVYVTRKAADGTIGTYSFSIGWTLAAMLLVWLNVMVWAVVGLIVAARVVL